MVQLLLGIIYLAFISLGLPDALLGSAWPSMYQEFGVPVSYAGIISMIISAGTVVSSLMSDRLTRRLGAGRVTAISVGMTAAALLGFSVSGSFPMLCILAVPYGLGAGSVDAALNNYVALHYASRHMSWLHCMWGLGASAGPYIMGYALTGGQGWNIGIPLYRRSADRPYGDPDLQSSMWKKRPETGNGEGEGQDSEPAADREDPGSQRGPCSPSSVLCGGADSGAVGDQLPGAGPTGFPRRKRLYMEALFFRGDHSGPAASGFLTMALGRCQNGEAGDRDHPWAAICTFLPFLGKRFCQDGSGTDGGGMRSGISLYYPCYAPAVRRGQVSGHHRSSDGQCLHRYPSDAASVRMLADHITIWLFPVFLLAITAVMGVMHEATIRKAGKRKP